MGRIPLVEYPEAPPDLRPLYEQITSARRQLLNVYKGLGNRPSSPLRLPSRRGM